ncbi:unnamed protein product [Rotaria sordida]|uniref:EF-hand domain-containing protein n=1 Tax=Rotaria sordida TaxID=392033 RepID=A0A814MAY2_9BILA|nr:unnamed protein product [Rotaria sordida]
MSLSCSSSNLVNIDRESSSSFNKKIISLPRIEHPSKLLNEVDKNSLDIRGRSRDGHGDGKLIRSETSTPESQYYRRRSSSFKRFHTDDDNSIYQQDRDKVRLPIFGHRADSRTSSSSSYGLESGKASPRTSRIIIDELERMLREKVHSQIHDVRTKFRHVTDLDSNGKISRQALQHIIASIFGSQRQIGPNQIDKLLERLHLKHLNKISFDEFINSLFTGEEELPAWLSRQSSTPEEFITKRTAAQMFIILKDKVRTKHKDLVRLCPSLDGGPPSRIFKAQFHNTLIDMGYRIKDKEFDKLWDKFDTDGFHAINSDKFLKRLTNEEFLNETPSIPTSEAQDQQTAILKARHRISSHTDSLVKTPRFNNDNQIDTWLNHKFPQGFSDLERALQRLDTKQIGTLSRHQFIEELKHFGLILEGYILDFLLKRFNIDLTLTNGLIPYQDVINAFKQRTDPSKRRINSQNDSYKQEYCQTSLERQVQYLISLNNERIQDELTRLDNNHNGTVSSNDMKSLIEDLLEFPLRPDEYYQLFKQFPIDENGKIKYKDYLKQVMDNRNSEQQEQEQKQKSAVIPQWDYMRSKNIRETLDQEHIKNKKREKKNDFNENNQEKTRSIEELREILKTVIRNRYKDIEEQFKKLDHASYGELTQDLLYDLFKHLNLKPEITRSEIILLWSRCHLKENGNLDFYQFLREFGYSKRSAHYPNAKQNPPKRGDADFLLTSRKLYGDSVLVHGAALNAIKSNWDQLRQEFTQLDPYRTGYLQSDEFDDILTELCPSVNQEDLDMLKFRFQTEYDSRMNYVRFLKHHAPLPELIGLVDESNKYSLPTINEKSPRSTSNQSVLNQVCNKLRRKLSDSSKQLRRTFKQRDSTNNGYVSTKAFKEILNQYKCSLNDEEFYTLTSQIDTKIDGTIDYNYFIQHYVKNN